MANEGKTVGITNEPDAIPAFEPTDVRYIKLGAGGVWERTALTGGTLEWGNSTDRHDRAEAGDWKGLHDHYCAMGLQRSTATAFTREARDFYQSSLDMLWITFVGGFLWWAFASSGVTDRGSNQAPGLAARYRSVVGAWRNTDLQGQPLRITDLSTRLTQLSAYRQSICSVASKDYLLRRIRGEVEPAVAVAQAARKGLSEALLPLIQHLHQSDFELFADLLFGAMGWRRRSILGGTMKDIDLLLELPATGQRACVQVKSTADQRLADKCLNAMRMGWPEETAILVCHTFKGCVAYPNADGRSQMFAGSDLARLAVDHGLTEWVLAKAG